MRVRRKKSMFSLFFLLFPLSRSNRDYYGYISDTALQSDIKVPARNPLVESKTTTKRNPARRVNMKRKRVVVVSLKRRRRSLKARVCSHSTIPSSCHWFPLTIDPTLRPCSQETKD